MQSKINERGLFLLGLLICFSVAAVSVLLEKVIDGYLVGTIVVHGSLQVETQEALDAVATGTCGKVGE